MRWGEGTKAERMNKPCVQLYSLVNITHKTIQFMTVEHDSLNVPNTEGWSVF